MLDDSSPKARVHCPPQSWDFNGDCLLTLSMT